MSYGFLGKAGKNYLMEVKESLTAAMAEHNEDPFSGYGGGIVPLPSLPSRSNKTAPYSPEEANSGGNATGIWNQTNVAAAQHSCDAAAQKLFKANDTMIGALSGAIASIAEMCESVYITPKTQPKVMSISGRIKSSLTGFRALPESSEFTVLNYSREILGGDPNIVWNQSAAEQIRAESEQAMSAQAENMQDTARAYERIACDLDAKAGEQDWIAATAMKESSWSDEKGNSHPMQVPDEEARAIARQKAEEYRKQASLLRAAERRLQSAIHNLEDKTDSANQRFWKSQEQIQSADQHYARLLLDINNEIEKFISGTKKIRDGITLL